MSNNEADYRDGAVRAVQAAFSRNGWHGGGWGPKPHAFAKIAVEAIKAAGYALVRVGEVPPWMELVVDQWGRTDDEGNPAPATYVKPPVYRLTAAPNGSSGDGAA